MARIRSLHPGQWTDEAFVSCSAFGRLLALALRNVADDQGVFEWKPLGLKMQVFPADNVDVAELLAELSASGQIVAFDASGRRYGAIRNFRKWQRPEKPKTVHPLPDDMRRYVGLSPIGPASNAGGSAIEGEWEEVTSATLAITKHHVDDPSPTGSGKPPQRKEEGGRRDSSPSSSLRSDEPPPMIDDKKAGGRLIRGTRLPEDWRPEQRDVDLALAEGMTPEQADREAARFRDHWRAATGQKGVKLDWPATWRNWVREAVDRQSRFRPARPAPKAYVC